MDFVFAKTKVQISCTITALLISAFVFATKIVHVQSVYFLNPMFKLRTIFCSPTAGFCHTWLKTLKAGFLTSQDAAHVSIFLFQSDHFIPVPKLNKNDPLNLMSSDTLSDSQVNESVN